MGGQHTPTTNLKCEVCGKSWSGQSGLWYHKKKAKNKGKCKAEAPQASVKKHLVGSAGNPIVIREVEEEKWYPRPRGNAPRNKAWNCKKGVWMARPKGCPPNGKVWVSDMATGLCAYVVQQ